MKLRSQQIYKGWKVTYSRYRPATGLWQAEKFGVGMCAGTSDQIQRMIDAKEATP